MTALTPPSCANCRFWVDDSSRYGYCQRNPPFQPPESSVSYWPKVHDGAWCGEHQHVAAPNLDLSIDHTLGFSVRVLNCLHSYDVRTLGALTDIPEHTMMRWRNFARKSLLEVRRILAGHGLETRDRLTTKVWWNQ